MDDLPDYIDDIDGIYYNIFYSMYFRMYESGLTDAERINGDGGLHNSDTYYYDIFADNSDTMNQFIDLVNKNPLNVKENKFLYFINLQINSDINLNYYYDLFFNPDA
jgi:hypothetical protein